MDRLDANIAWQISVQVIVGGNRKETGIIEVYLLSKSFSYPKPLELLDVQLRSHLLSGKAWRLLF